MSYPPVAGLRLDRDHARDNKPSGREVKAMLAAYRAGCPLAHAGLLYRLRYLLYDAVANQWHVLGRAWLSYHAAIRRLTINGKKDAVRYIANELRYAKRRQWREDRPIRIEPPDSTNRTRRRRKQKEYPTMTQTTTVESRHRTAPPDSRQRPDTLVERSDLRSPIETPAGKPYRQPSRLRTKIEIDLTGAGPLAAAIASKVLEGYSQREIAEALNITQHRVRAELALLRDVVTID